ncbi:hypothetical protein Acsp05_43220 [Actinokineospora sp. NBRC 105648]|nr:hypothetical protein Acsp05_43220 [Actinokineospora sp. NBRC 105648]
MDNSIVTRESLGDDRRVRGLGGAPPSRAQCASDYLPGGQRTYVRRHTVALMDDLQWNRLVPGEMVEQARSQAAITAKAPDGVARGTDAGKVATLPARRCRIGPPEWTLPGER